MSRRSTSSRRRSRAPSGTTRRSSARIGADAIRELKERLHGDLYVSGSGTLVRALLADGLVDELHLFVFPLALGAGQRLFVDGGPAAKFALAGTEAYESGVLHLNYRPSE